MNNQETTFSRQTAINGLAVVGFIALIALGMWLAVYSTRFVPTVVNKIGAAAVYLGSVFTPASDSTLSVVPTPTATTTISFGTAPTSPADIKPAPTASGKKVTITPIATTPVLIPPVLSGFPDLAITVVTSGYLTTTSDDSFVASSTAPDGTRPAVKFFIKNIGTNVSGSWRFSALLPTRTTYTYESPLQQSLNPGDSTAYTLGFDRARTGADQTISVTANFDGALRESVTTNNTASARITIL